MMQRLIKPVASWLVVALVLISVLLLWVGNRSLTHSDLLKRIELTLEQRLGQDSAVIFSYWNHARDSKILKALDDSPFYIEIFSGDSVVYWTDRTEVGRLPSGHMVRLLDLRHTDATAVISLNPVQLSGHSDVTKVLPAISGLRAYINTANDSTIQIRGHILMPEFRTSGHHSVLLSGAWWLIFLAVVLLAGMAALNRIPCPRAFNRKICGSILALVILIVFRLVNSLTPFKSLFGQSILTRPFGSGLILAEDLSDLLVNLALFVFLVWSMQISSGMLSKSGKHTSALAFAAGFFTYTVFGASLRFIESLVMIPFVNLEIEALLQFDVISYILMVSYVVLMFLIFHSTQILFSEVENLGIPSERRYLWMATGWMAGITVLYLLGWLNVPVWILTIFVVAYSLVMDAYCEKREKKITYLIWWLMMFSGFLAISLFNFGLKKNIRTRSQFMQDYYHQPSDETLRRMNQLSDSLIAGDVFSRIASLDAPSRFDQHDLHQYIFGTDSLNHSYAVELFDKRTGSTLFNNHFADFHKLNQTYLNSSRIAKNLVHNPFENSYLLRFEIARSVPANTSWYLFIVRREPGIFSGGPGHAHGDFGYAVFSDNRLIEKKDGLQASPDLAAIQAAAKNSINNGYSFVVSEQSDQYRIVSWQKVSGLIKPISLFSFIFTLAGLLILILTLINTRYDFLPENLSLKFGARSSLKTKIQLAIILLIIVTFLIIGAITAFYFKNLMEANQKLRQREELESIVNNLRSDIQYLADDESSLNYITSKLKDLAYIYNKDLSVYDRSGRLAGFTSSQNNNIRIPYSIWKSTNSDGHQADLTTDTESGRDYVPLYLAADRPFAYLGVTHQNFNTSANILDFLSTILNAYIFLFLIAGAIAITIANSITQPLSILADKLKKFKLGKSNELLEWKSNDEIGTLITDYNNLTQELERSAGLLAKTERDMAWREMAKQVAHEIKNPLTPMKLSIQYLDKATREQPEKAGEMVPRVSATLIEQIDNLSQIASEFSNFAAMPQATNEKVVLNEIVETIHDLFRKREDMDISMIEPIDELYVFADKNHLVRILNNLLKNAIQAIPDNRRGRIEIELKRQNNDAVIRISDNGTGIPDHMKEKVFTPNFTTKSSGTGLGLAISANMIESFNGRIFFETRPGEGTDFYISIPLMRLDEYLSDESRVELED